MQFKKAVKSKCKARVALYGPSGSGKTFSALRIAKGLGQRIALIDTENFSASKYADRFEFETLDLQDHSPEGYIAAIAAAKEFDVLIIDSISHGWETLVEDNDKLANARYRGNSWSAWSESTPRQRNFISAITSFPGHVITTMRSKTEWAQESGSGGKTKPIRVGLAPEQRKGVEYEFDIVISLSIDHVASVEKDRSGKFQDKLIDKPGEEFGATLAAWLSEGVIPVAPAAPPPPAPTVPPPKFERFEAALASAANDDELDKLADGIPKKKEWDLQDKTVAWSKWFRRAVQLAQGHKGRLEFLRSFADDKAKTAVVDEPIKSSIDADLAIAFAALSQETAA